jgi:hypothetical protein
MISDIMKIKPKRHPTANCSFYDRFHVTAEETEGRFVYSIGDHAWDIPAFFLLQGNGFFDKLLQAQKIK